MDPNAVFAWGIGVGIVIGLFLNEAIMWLARILAMKGM